MMNLVDVVDPAKIRLVTQVFSDKTHLLDELLGLCLQDSYEKSKITEIRETLLEREESMSTGIGSGVAIPHCSSKHVSGLEIIFCRLQHPVEFDSIDKKPIQICILILFPKYKFDVHIKLLASIARLCGDAGIRNQILQAADSTEIMKIIQSVES